MIYAMPRKQKCILDDTDYTDFHGLLLFSLSVVIRAIRAYKCNIQSPGKSYHDR